MTTAQETYAMLDKQSLWAAAARVHLALAEQSIPHALVGGVAVCLHGYQRNTVDIDWLVRSDENDAIRQVMGSIGFVWDETVKEFRDESGMQIQFLLAGDRAGKGSEVQLPDPNDPNSIVMIEGLPVLSLARLIESKIACGEGNVRRTHKDFADVVELIAWHSLGGEFTKYLHKAVRRTYRQLLKNARGEA